MLQTSLMKGMRWESVWIAVLLLLGMTSVRMQLEFTKHPIKITLSHFTPLRVQPLGGEWCARLHQRKNNQDRKIYRGDKEDGTSHCQGVWCLEKYRPQGFDGAIARN